MLCMCMPCSTHILREPLSTGSCCQQHLEKEACQDIADSQLDYFDLRQLLLADVAREDSVAGVSCSGRDLRYRVVRDMLQSSELPGRASSRLAS